MNSVMTPRETIRARGNTFFGTVKRSVEFPDGYVIGGTAPPRIYDHRSPWLARVAPNGGGLLIEFDNYASMSHFTCAPHHYIPFAATHASEGAAACDVVRVYTFTATPFMFNGERRFRYNLHSLKLKTEWDLIDWLPLERATKIWLGSEGKEYLRELWGKIRALEHSYDVYEIS